MTGRVTNLQRRSGGKAALPARKRPRYRETPDVVAGVCRIIESIGKRIATEDPDSLLLLGDLERELRQAWATAVAGMRQTGFTDREIGENLGTTRQAVEQRWPRTVGYRSDPETGGRAVESG